MSRYLVGKKRRQRGRAGRAATAILKIVGSGVLTVFVGFLVAYYILPQYFGIRLPGFDLTAQRMLITILCLFLLSKESRKKMFWEGVS